MPHGRPFSQPIGRGASPEAGLMRDGSTDNRYAARSTQPSSPSSNSSLAAITRYASAPSAGGVALGGSLLRAGAADGGSGTLVAATTASGFAFGAGGASRPRRDRRLAMRLGVA